MKIINWRRTDWIARTFIFSIGQEIFGQLSFNSAWNFNAVYTDKETDLKFAQKNFWNRDVLITKDGKAIGEIRCGLFEQTLKLITGERFFLYTSLWEQEVYWKTEKGEKLIKYKQATMSSMGKGVISSSDSMAVDRERLLISSGIIVRQLFRKRRALTVALMVPIIAGASRL
jgi:hypothetical protein